MGKIRPPRRPARPAKAPVEAVGVKDAQGVAVGKIWRPKAVGVKDAQGVAVIAIDGQSVLGARMVAPARCGKKGLLLEDGIAVCRMDALDGAPVIATTRRQEGVRLKDAKGVAVGKMQRPWRPAKAPLKAVGVKNAKGAAVIAVGGEVVVSVLGAPAVVAARGKKKGSLEDGIAVCQMDALAGAPVISTARKEAVGLKDAKGVAAGKMWLPRRSAKAPLEMVEVKDTKGVAVITVDGEAVLGAPVVMAAGGKEKRSLEDGIAVCQMDALDGAPVISTTRKEAVGLKDAKGVAVGTMWRPRRPVKAPLEAVRVKDVEGVAVIVVTEEVEASVLGAPVVVADRAGERGPLEDGIAMCRMDVLDGASVTAMTRKEAAGQKDAKGVAMGKMWRPRQPLKATLEAVRVKDAEGVAVIAVEGKVEASVLGAPVVMVVGGDEKGSLEDGLAVSGTDALDGAPVIAPTEQEAVGLKDAKGVRVGKKRRPRRPAKAPFEGVRVKDAEGVAVIAVDEEVEAPVLGAQVVTAAEGGEKGSLEYGTAVSGMDALDGAPVIAMTRQEVMGLKSAKRAAVGKMRRPRQPAKAPLEVVGVKDAEGIAVIDVDRKVEVLVLGAPVVTADRGIEKGPLEEGIAVCKMDTLDGAPVIATTQHEAVGVKDVEGVAGITVDGEVEASVLGVPVVAAARGGEKGSLEDGMTVCRRETFEGAPVIATDEKSEVSMQGDPVVPAVDQKVDAPVVEAVQAITMKGNGKEKDEEGIKWLKHYSTAQSILIVGDGDFSFSLALATTFGSGGNLVATSLDSYGALTRKYAKAESNVRELKRLGATVLHGVDAKTMKLHSYLEARRFDRIVFNFPHAGFKGKEDHLHVITAHKQLVHGFLANAWQLLRPYGETHISHKTGFPYDAWHIEQLAYESCLIMVRKVGFSKEDYPGYNQKRGDGATCDESFPLGPCCTYMFCVGDVEKLKQAHGNRVGSMISSCLGDSKFYPGISATDMMWPFGLHPAWPQPHFPPVHMPTAFYPCPCGVAEMEHPVNCYGTSFHQQDMVQPTHQEQPWYQEYQSLQREYEIHRQLTLSLEDCYMESVQRQAMLGMLI